MADEQLDRWIAQELATLPFPDNLEPHRNRLRLDVEHEGERLAIRFCQESLDLEPRWIARATITFMLDRKVAILNCIHVVPAFRTQGLGRQIVEKLEHLARHLALTRIWIDTPSQEGQAFFKRLGYQEVAARPVTIIHGHIYLIRLEKPLSENGSQK